jgi:hypothetical protein
VLRMNTCTESAGHMTLTFSPLWRKKDPLARLTTDEKGGVGGSESISGGGSKTRTVSIGALKSRAGLKALLRKICPAVRKPPNTGSRNIEDTQKVQIQE